jgi:micrococcal nuclease
MAAWVHTVSRAILRLRTLGLATTCAVLDACQLAPTDTVNPNTGDTTLPAPRDVVAYLPNATAPKCAITRVVDGDTIKVACSESQGNVRLVGFDTPETFRPRCNAEKRLGEHAKATLETLLRTAHQIDLRRTGIDKYSRALARVYIDGVDVAKPMIAQGLAVPYDGGKRMNWCQALLG